MRNVDALGVTKLYVVTDREDLRRPNGKMRAKIRKCSASADKWIYVRFFETTAECFAHLERAGFTSLVTSPHIQGMVNLNLIETDFTTYRKLAVWFGNEARGISEEAVARSEGCVQLDMAGIIESLNLAVSTGIILHHISVQRRRRSGKLCREPPVAPTTPPALRGIWRGD